jgi:hypothetical protein
MSLTYVISDLHGRPIPSFRGASETSEPENPDAWYSGSGFRVRAKARPEMTESM